NDLKAVDFVSDTPANVTQYGLGKPHLVVTVYTGTHGAQQSLLFGFKQTEQGKDGIYVRRGESTPVYTVHEYIMTSLDKHLLDLRDKTVLDFQPSDVQSASVKVESDQFSVERKTGGWSLILGGKTEPADVPAVERMLDDVRELKGSAIV